MTRENKAGILVSCSFLALVGVVVVTKLREPPPAGAPAKEARQVAAADLPPMNVQSDTEQPGKRLPPGAPDGSGPAVAPPAATAPAAAPPASSTIPPAATSTASTPAVEVGPTSLGNDGSNGGAQQNGGMNNGTATSGSSTNTGGTTSTGTNGAGGQSPPSAPPPDLSTPGSGAPGPIGIVVGCVASLLGEAGKPSSPAPSPPTSAGTTATTVTTVVPPAAANSLIPSGGGGSLVPPPAATETTQPGTAAGPLPAGTTRAGEAGGTAATTTTPPPAAAATSTAVPPAAGTSSTIPPSMASSTVPPPAQEARPLSDSATKPGSPTPTPGGSPPPPAPEPPPLPAPAASAPPPRPADQPRADENKPAAGTAPGGAPEHSTFTPTLGPPRTEDGTPLRPAPAGPPPAVSGLSGQPDGPPAAGSTMPPPQALGITPTAAKPDPVGATPRAIAPAIQAGAPPVPRADTTPSVAKSYSVTRHLCQGGDTFGSVCQRYYGREDFAAALQAFNRVESHRCGSPALAADGKLAAGDVVYVPMLAALESEASAYLPRPEATPASYPAPKP